MRQPTIIELVNDIWWLLFNGYIQYLEIDFLAAVTDNHERKYIPLWIIVNEFLVIWNLYFRLPNIFFIHILLLLVFSIFFMKRQWTLIVAPWIIISTLYTFMEGYSAVFMYWISRNMRFQLQGIFFQILISLILIVIYFCIVRFIQKRYLSTMQWPAASYLYILLFPCTFMVIMVRWGLKLDSHNLENYFSSIGIDTGFAVFMIMNGAIVIFLIMIKTFYTIVRLAQQETNMAILQVQLEGQKIYVEEAKKRNQEYSKFQHDINNHLLVLSGLIKKKEYVKADEYINKLHISSQSLAIISSTGNAILDILLDEKVSYAIRNGISISCNVKIPDDFSFDDMDLNIIFANILDNAIQECINFPCKESTISIYGKTHGHFFLIESINTSRNSCSIKDGIGLTNIKNVAAKYQGTVEISNENGKFRISVLLCASNRLS